MSRRPHLRSSAAASTVLLALTGLPLPTAALAQSAETASTALSTPAGTTHTSVPLPLDGFAAVVVDEHANRIFYSSGPDGDTVLVTDLAGAEVGWLPGLAGPTGMALGGYGSLWVALARGNAIAEFDAQTLQPRRTVRLPDGVCPGDLAANGRYLVFGYSCVGYAGSGPTGGVGQFRHDDVAELVPSFTTKGPTVRPVVDISLEYRTLAVAAESGDLGPAGSPTVSSLHLEGGVPAVTATTPIGAGLRDLGIHPWHLLLVTSTADPAQHGAFDLPAEPFGGTITSRSALAPGGAARATAWAYADRFAAASDNPEGPDVVLHSARSVPGSRAADVSAFAALELGEASSVQPGGLAWDTYGHRVFAVTRDGSGAYALQVFALPTGTSATLSGPDAGRVGDAVTLTGHLAFADGEVPVGEYLDVRRRVTTSTGHVTETWVPPVLTDSTGGFTLADAPTEAGRTTYTVSWSGTREPASASWTLEVSPKSPATVTLTGPETSPVGRELALTGTVRHADGTIPAGASLAVTRRTGTALPVQLPPVTATPNGAFTVVDTPPATGQTGYVVTYNGTTDAGSNRVTVDVQKRAATLDVTAPSSLYVGQVVRLTGSLRFSDGTPGGGQALTVVRTLGGTTTTRSTTTGSDGTYVLDDTPSATGTATYAVSYSSPVEQASASRVVEVKPKIGSTMTLTGPGSVAAGQALTLTGSLQHGDGTAGAGAVLAVTRTHGGTTTALPAVTAGSDGTFRVPDTAPTAGDALYTIRYAGDPAHQPTSATAKTAVTLNPTDLTLTATLDKKRSVVALVAHLGPTLANRVVRITAQPSGGTSTLVLEGAVDANGYLRATYGIKTTTTFTATFTADGWNAAATATATVRR